MKEDPGKCRIVLDEDSSYNGTHVGVPNGLHTSIEPGGKVSIQIGLVLTSEINHFDNLKE